jgi:hypothetical protein
MPQRAARIVGLLLALCAAMLAAQFLAGCGNAAKGESAPPADDDDHAPSVDDDDVTDDDDDDDDDNNDDDNDDDDTSPTPSIPILNVIVEDATSYRLMNPWLTQYTGDLWPAAWGADDRLYTANGDGFGFGVIPGDIVVNVVDGQPPAMTGRNLPGARSAAVAGLWGPEIWTLNRKPTGMTCVDGDLYLFFQNLANGRSADPFGYAPNASISVSRDGGATWQYGHAAPMFSDRVFTTGFFLDLGRCSEHAFDEFVYVYGVDGNWRWSETCEPTELFLARVHRDRILERAAWEFFAGMDGDAPTWTAEIADKAPVLVDETRYTSSWTGVAQGSVVFIPALNRYLYSTRARYEWIFHEAQYPWGPWTRITVREWLGAWTEQFHAGYPATIPSKFLDADGLGGWIVSSLSSSTFNGMYYNMNLRRFWLETARGQAPAK